MPCCAANASMLRYFARFDGSVFWMSWSAVNTGCEGSCTFLAPMALNFFITAEVLSCVITWSGRIDRKSPARSGRLGPSAMCVCEIFSTIVCPICLSPALAIGVEELHQLAHARLLLQRPNRIDRLAPCGLCHHRPGQRLEFLFNFPVGQRIAQIALGIIQLLAELAAVGRLDGHYHALQHRKNLFNLRISYYDDLVELSSNRRIHDLFDGELQRRDLPLRDSGSDHVG